MQLPHLIIEDLPANSQSKWQRQFVDTGRQRHEGVWRRTQEPRTAHYSGYKDASDARWKLVHFYDTYGLREEGERLDLVLEKPYLWINSALPSDEMQVYQARLNAALQAGGWTIESNDDFTMARRGDLCAVLKHIPLEEAKQLSGLDMPDTYEVVDIEIFGPDQHLTDEERGRPWNILRKGIRKPLAAGNPAIINEQNADEFDLEKYVPFHLELGCGPSIEAGVPPLSYLHKTYAISDPRTHHFIIGLEDDLAERYFNNPELFHEAASLLYASAMRAEPNTDFYQNVKRMFDAGTILGPVYTNNYDGLMADMNIPEHYLRKFDDSHLFPDVEFNEDAKALVVVGSHADRRKLQEKARAQGLQVIYVDPQRYKDVSNGEIYRYGIESPQDADALINMTAKEFSDTFLEKVLNVTNHTDN